MPGLILTVASLGALLLLVAEFTTLFEVRASGSPTVVRSVGTGSHHTYALIPLALLAALLGFGVWWAHSRPALLAIGAVGVLALLIALLGDLPDAHSTGLLRVTSGRFVSVDARPSAGFYMETLGAVALLIASVGGFLLVGPPPDRHTVGTNRS